MYCKTYTSLTFRKHFEYKAYGYLKKFSWLHREAFFKGQHFQITIIVTSGKVPLHPQKRMRARQSDKK